MAALEPAPVRADAVQPLQAAGVDLSITASSPDPQTVVSRTDIAAQISALQARLQVGMQGGQAMAAAGAPSAGWWNSGEARLSATWTPAPLAKVDLSASNSLRLDAAPTGLDDGGRRRVETRKRALQGSMTLAPNAPLHLTLGAESAADTVLSAPVGGVTDVHQTQAQRLFAEAQWKPAAPAAFDLGGKMEATGVYVAGLRLLSYAVFDPSLGATLEPWAGASWRLSLTRAAAPLSPDQFIGYGAGAGPVGLANLQPSREWRYEALIEQKSGSLDFTARLTQARLQSYAYLAPYGQTAGRVGSGAGDRSELQAAVQAPLPRFGLGPFTLKASGAWRVSQAQDPLTGAIGRLSGESPYDASLSLTQAVAGSRMSWGLTASATGPARTFFTSQVTSLSAAAGLGGFLQYSPGPVTLQLRLENLIGGDRAQQDVYYAGPRDLNVIDRIDALHVSDRAIRLSLSRPL